ncbi:hypothetical protein [Homoserinibacter sp. YIM 151385]|uniref:hypothetical protein n=1 Tax=Homoserinibacter sp. YIM 151385 TaxID=2985506 RepID=UPI0022F0B89C|nr:hypothetical protein [Homoserinibacter sp. YIM 151385]WBU36709.1 hypothetical protein OF852_07100 [Homoserinibacter sp. YIM 151385]
MLNETHLGGLLARRRGFFAELQHQSQLAAREAERRQRAAATAVRQAEAARRAEQRAYQAAVRASDVDRRRLEREAQAAHVDAMQAEVEDRNAELADNYAELEGLLAATLDVDDYVDLEQLKRRAEHPPFPRWDLETPTPPPGLVPRHPEPVRWAPAPVTGLFNRQKKIQEAAAQAEADFLRAHEEWWRNDQQYPAYVESLHRAHVDAEALRERTLAEERAKYQAACDVRDREVAEHNAQVDRFIANLGYGDVEAVQDYVSIVLANSVYPEGFPVEYDAGFDATTAELKLQVEIPAPSDVPKIKSWRYVKASDEIVSTDLSARDMKARYASIVNQVALRTLHEVFEADRRQIVKSMSIEVGVRTNDPATGQTRFIPFVAVSTARETFVAINLSGIVPSATLEHLGAATSKNPFELVAANGSGVRRA